MISFHRGNRGVIFLFRLLARCIAGRRLGIFFGIGVRLGDGIAENVGFIAGLGDGIAENGGFIAGLGDGIAENVGFVGGDVLEAALLPVFIVGERFGDCVPLYEGGGDGLGEFGDFLARGLCHECIYRDLGIGIVGDYHGYAESESVLRHAHVYFVEGLAGDFLETYQAGHVEGDCYGFA